MKNQLPPLSVVAHNLKPGIYQHYKGDFYEVFFVARYSEDPSQEFVVYQKIETGDMWVRPIKMFCETVEVEGYSQSRFKFVESI